MDLIYAEEQRLTEQVEKAFRYHLSLNRARAVVPGVPLVLERIDLDEIRAARRRLTNAERELYEFRDANYGSKKVAP